MPSPSMKGKPLTLRELLELSLLAALQFGAKVAMAMLPNVHLGAVLLIAATMRHGIKTLYMVFVYVMLEGLIYGFGQWWISYLYIWPLLVFAVLPFRRGKRWLVLSVVGALHGYLFGALCAVTVAFLGGIPAAVSYWIAGIPFDLLHGTANFVLCITLLPPLDRLSQKFFQYQQKN